MPASRLWLKRASTWFAIEFTMLKIQCPSCRLVMHQHEEVLRHQRNQSCPICGMRWQINLPVESKPSAKPRSRNRYDRRKPDAPPPGQSTQRIWLVAGGVVLVVLLAFMAVAGVFIWLRPWTGAESTPPAGAAAAAPVEPPKGAHVKYDDFLQVKQGMTVHDTLALLGDPTTDTGGADRSSRTMQWRDGKTYQVEVVFVRGVVHSATWSDIIDGQQSLKVGPTGGLRIGP